jgi:hypothetical protein
MGYHPKLDVAVLRLAHEEGERLAMTLADLADSLAPLKRDT